MYFFIDFFFSFSDTKVSCCDSTMLKINFVTPNDVKDTHLPVSYKHFIRTTPAIHLAKKTYQLDKKCDYDYKSCCDQYRSCCEQPKPIKQSDTGSKLLKGFDTLDRILDIFCKGDSIYGFTFAFQNTNPLVNRGLL